jgi:hypothetical protein
LTLGHLGDWPRAADLAGRYVAGAFDSDGQGVGYAHITLGRGLLADDRPDPAGAAHAGIQALRATVGPDTTVMRRAAGLHADLVRRWADVAGVAELGDALSSARKALPSGGSAASM